MKAAASCGACKVAELGTDCRRTCELVSDSDCVVWMQSSGTTHSQVSAAFSLSGSNSAVECQLPKLDVAGSIPVSRSMLGTVDCIAALHARFLCAVPSGKMRECGLTKRLIKNSVVDSKSGIWPGSRGKWRFHYLGSDAECTSAERGSSTISLDSVVEHSGLKLVGGEI